VNPGLGSVVRRGVLVSTDMVPRTFLGEEYKVGAPAWLATAVSEFGAACHAKLAGPGDREAAIRAPLEGLLRTVGTHLRVPAEFYDEVRDSARQVRPDYGVAVKGAITGYIEVKAPDKPIDPATFRGHDLRQWERQKDLPNLLYTNGTEWRLYRDGQPHGEPIVFTGGRLDDAGESLTTPPEFERLITDFLNWKPAPITSVGALVRAIAPLTRLLRGEVVDQLADERQAIAAGAEEYTQPFTGLARDWRNLLFPQADDKTFADGYAQAVAFALLLARTEGIRVDGVSLHEVGRKLSTQHSLMGRALQLLTDDVAADFKVTLDLLVRIIGAVDWPRVRKGKRDTYLHLYEHFLEQYDNELRKQSGTYYTPREVVDHMVRLTEEALVTRLGKAKGFRDDAVVTVDPAMGTGTYLLTILERAAEQAAAHDGPGAVPGALAEVAKRLVGFELQMGPYAVAELRTADLLNLHGATKSGAEPVRHQHPRRSARRRRRARTQSGPDRAVTPPGEQGQGQHARHRRHRQPSLQGARRRRRELGGVRQRRRRQESPRHPRRLLRRRRESIQGEAEEPLRVLLAMGHVEGLGVHTPGERRRRRGRLLHLHCWLPHRARIHRHAALPAQACFRRLDHRPDS